MREPAIAVIICGVESSRDRSSVWNEVAELYGEGISPFGFFSVELVKGAMLSPGERVLDLGTGNGLGLIPAAQAVAPAVVVSVDFASGMLEAAKRRAAAAGISNIELRRMDVTRLEFPDDSFDVAIASSVFQFVGFSSAVLVEWRRVLQPGGRLAFSTPDLGVDPAAIMLVDLIAEHAASLPSDVAARFNTVQANRRNVPDLPALCRNAGFANASGAQLRLRTTVASAGEWWKVQWSHGIRAVLREFDDATLDAIKGDAALRLEGARDNDGRIPFELTMAVCHAIK